MIRVYQYGLLDPTENAELVSDQIRLAHRYRNTLIEIERERRATNRAILAAHPTIGPLETELAEWVRLRDEQRMAIRTTRRATRSRSESTEQRTQVHDSNAQIRETITRLKAARKALNEDPEIGDRFRASHAHALARRRKARGECGVYWGSYLLQEKAAQQARKATSPPEFRPYRGEGRVGVQLQGGLELKDCWGADTQLQIAPVDQDAYDPLTRTSRRDKRMRTQIRIRIGSDPKSRTPIWAMWPMIMHRPLPDGVVVKDVTISRRRRDCRRWEWRAQLTVDAPENPTRPGPADGAVALNLGFAIRPDGAVRAGYLVGNDGAEQEILAGGSRALRTSEPLDDASRKINGVRVSEAIAKAESIRSIRDRDLDRLRATLLAWRAAYAETHEMPEWFVERTSHLHATKAPRRFAALARTWRAQRFPDDAAGYDLLAAWRYRDEHLERYESGTRRRALGDRREGYRLLAARMAARYRTLLIDDTNLSELQRSPEPEDDAEIASVKAHQRLANGSGLRLALVNAFGPTRIRKTSAVNVTAICHACRTKNVWARLSGERNHTCTTCGIRWDQDANACRNLLHLLHEWSDTEANSERARNDKPVELKITRYARMQAAKSRAKI